ncbi:acireductone synthase [uncultured Sphingomonas sp.]|uniref:acireductone synthase n=1 Tax=uncultured Sphingomonas sp. TaxID=158754 RepID=UPI0035CAB62B
MPLPPSALLLDVEGTTTSTAFVTDTLFPYARERLAAYVPIHREELASILAGMPPGDPVATLLGWMDHDAKEPALKEIQGRIWREGYEAGALAGHVYPDTVAAFHRWSRAGVPTYIYSSGSVEAQQLLFAHSVEGDLTPMLSGYFDTRVGAKREAASYQAIAAELRTVTPAMLFVSDTPAEVDAARAAGMAAMLIDRDGGRGDVASLADVLP